MSYSKPVNLELSKEELLKKIHTLPNHPDWIPYRTTYYKEDWGFCCSHNLLNSEKFAAPFEVKIDSKLDYSGKLNWLECTKKGSCNEEILISTYCCHPNLANDNLSGLITAVFLFDYLKNIETKYTYRLLIAPETIGVISFLSKADLSNVKGGMIMSCTAGPDKFSIKEGYDNQHWINKAAVYALEEMTKGDFIKYPFVPDGSDERQFSSPGIRIITPSIHRSKYYEYPEYHTSADNLNFISSENLVESLEVHKKWIKNIESFCYPKRTNLFCEYQLGKRGLYPDVGGTLSQPAHHENNAGNNDRKFSLNDIKITGKHLNAYSWIMHLADGSISNFEIAKRSGLPLDVINDSIEAFYQNYLLIL